MAYRRPESGKLHCRWRRNVAPLLGHASGERGFRLIAEKFDTFAGHGPTCVRRFVEDAHALGDRTPEQWQQDAFGQIDALLRAMALRD